MTPRGETWYIRAMNTPKGDGGRRGLTVRVKTARGRKISSSGWLRRQLNDPYVAKAKREGYKSRAAYKLIELDDKFHFLHHGIRVLDLGAAPGGWTQVAVERVKSGNDDKRVLAVDMLAMTAPAGADFLQLDFSGEDAPRRIFAALGGRVEVVLSDIAPNTTGHRATDHLRILAVAELAFDFACEVLEPGGTFVCKMRQGGTERELLAKIRRRFAKVSHAKPHASRKDSAETYVVATGFRAPP